MLISICIPTKNRATLLEKSLSSIVRQEAFFNRNDVEIFISDNASDDNTTEVVSKFIDIFPDRIRYHRNTIDVEDSNFELALNSGKGTYLKLANDSLEWLPDSLERLITLVEMTLVTKPVLFFLNGSKKTSDIITEVNNIEELIKNVSFYITWIGCFGIWKTHLNQMPDFGRHASLKLVQVDAILRLMEKVKKGYVCNNVMFKVLPTGPKGGYNIAQVFGTNYLFILKQFDNHFSNSTKNWYKREILEHHILPYYCNAYHKFGDIEIEKHLLDYHTEPYFKDMILTAKKQRALNVAIANKKNLPILWRERNKHNKTEIRNSFDIEKVQVGRASYGPLNVFEWGHPNEKLIIGHYVSISEGASFILGGNHPYEGLMTFPVKVSFLGFPNEAETKGAIIVGDDVWIGRDAMILSGVKISQGAIIAAGSVVTRDIPPYAIAAGNPAKIIKYRFPDNVIELLLKIDYSKIQPTDLAEIGEDIYKSFEMPEFISIANKLINLSKIR